MGSQWEDKSKPHLNIVFIGHVDHGKSTTVGRLLLDSGHIEEHVVEKNEKLAAEQGKAGFGLAYVMDGLKEERERGITIDVAHKEFFTPSYYWTIIDAPGHRDFVKNMITGASQADAAVLLCAANDGVNAQTKEHAFLARVLGVKELIVQVNKMDISGVDWAEEKYKKTCDEVSNLLKMAGFDPTNIPMIPGSSLIGDNVYNKSDKTPWYSGPTLFQAILLTSLFACQFRMSTKLVELEQYQSARLRQVSSMLERQLSSTQVNRVLKSSLLRCTIQTSQRQSLETTLDSTYVDWQQPISAVAMLQDTATTSQCSFATMSPSSAKSS
jgi:small GTP-binding protein